MLIIDAFSIFSSLISFLGGCVSLLMNLAWRERESNYGVLYSRAENFGIPEETKKMSKKDTIENYYMLFCVSRRKVSRSEPVKNVDHVEGKW